MRPLTTEWIEKAEADFRHIELACNAAVQGHDLICFLSQQCAEKYVKAILQEGEIAFPKTHDLRVLIGLLDPPVTDLNALLDRLDHVTAWAVDVRYPGFFASAHQAEEAVAVASEVRAICRKILLRNS